MADLPSAANIKEIISLFAPGLIILWARSRVTAGPIPDLQERLISYALASTAYYGAVSPLFYVANGVSLPSWLWASLQYAFFPACLGWLLAYGSQRGWEYQIANNFGQLSLCVMLIPLLYNMYENESPHTPPIS